MDGKGSGLYVNTAAMSGVTRSVLWSVLHFEKSFSYVRCFG